MFRWGAGRPRLVVRIDWRCEADDPRERRNIELLAMMSTAERSARITVQPDRTTVPSSVEVRASERQPDAQVARVAEDHAGASDRVVQQLVAGAEDLGVDGGEVVLRRDPVPDDEGRRRHRRSRTRPAGSRSAS